ncbi:MAG: preprotein translocase subunit SecE [Calditrichaeota bacterium]|nr:preprotein translocase subunit SecE [Calditrichota bacterium]
MFRKLNKFIQEVKQEMSKVSWPGKEELKGTTRVVIMVTLVLTLFIFAVDKILEAILNFIF